MHGTYEHLSGLLLRPDQRSCEVCSVWHNVERPNLGKGRVGDTDVDEDPVNKEEPKAKMMFSEYVGGGEKENSREEIFERIPFRDVYSRHNQIQRVLDLLHLTL